MRQIMKTTAITLALMISITLIAPALASAAVAQDQPTEPKAPRPRPGSVQVNATDTVPRGFAQRVEAGNPQVLRFSNMVIEINSNRRMTVNVSSDDAVRLRYFAMNMTATRNTRLNVKANSTHPKDVEAPRYGIRKYLTIEPNNTAPVRATLRLFMNETELNCELNRTVLMKRLTWCFWNGTGWEPVRSRLTADGFLEAETDHFSLWTVMEQRHPREVPTPETPGVPRQTRALNYTDTVPNRFQYSLREREGTLLQFKNTAMYVNATRRVRLNVTAEEQFRQRLLKLEVEPSEALSLDMQLRASKPDEVEPAENYLGFYCVIEPNATAPLQATLGAEIDPAQLQEELGREIDPQNLTWAYWNGTHWDPVESELTDDGVLEAETDHFSTWTIMEVSEEAPQEAPEETETPETTETEEPGETQETEETTETVTGADNTLLYAGAAVAVIAVAALLLFGRRS